MKFNLSNFTKKKHLTLIGVSGSSSRLHSLRDWAIGLALAVVLFLGGVSYIAFDFYTQFGVEKEQVTGGTPLQYNASKVHMYAEKYNEKERAYEGVRSAPRAETPTIIKEQEPTPTPAEPTADVPQVDEGLAGQVIVE